MYGEHEAHMHWHTLDAEHRDGYCRIPASYAVLLQGGHPLLRQAALPDGFFLQACVLDDLPRRCLVIELWSHCYLQNSGSNASVRYLDAHKCARRCRAPRDLCALP